MVNPFKVKQPWLRRVGKVGTTKTYLLIAPSIVWRHIVRHVGKIAFILVRSAAGAFLKSLDVLKGSDQG